VIFIRQVDKKPSVSCCNLKRVDEYRTLFEQLSDYRARRRDFLQLNSQYILVQYGLVLAD
jgi:hypothetical protein